MRHPSAFHPLGLVPACEDASRGRRSSAVVGCTVWSSQSCGAQKSCTNGSCTSTCTNTCTAGAKRCTNQSAEQCVAGGNGCTSWVAGATCDSGFGNCSDFHSLFISMARANNIPAKFEIGYGVPTPRGR